MKIHVCKGIQDVSGGDALLSGFLQKHSTSEGRGRMRQTFTTMMMYRPILSGSLIYMIIVSNGTIAIEYLAQRCLALQSNRNAR